MLQVQQLFQILKDTQAVWLGTDSRPCLYLLALPFAVEYSEFLQRVDVLLTRPFLADLKVLVFVNVFLLFFSEVIVQDNNFILVKSYS